MGKLPRLSFYNRTRFFYARVLVIIGSRATAEPGQNRDQENPSPPKFPALNPSKLAHLEPPQQEPILSSALFLLVPLTGGVDR